MRENCARVQLATVDQATEPTQQLFAIYGQNDHSPVLASLPILLGLLASLLVALVFCPVPRPQAVSPARALFLAITYVLATVAIGAGVLAACSIVVARQRRVGLSFRWLRLFASAAAWMTPLVAFYKRDSIWAVAAAFVFSGFVSSLIYRCYLTPSVCDMARTDEHQMAELSYSNRLILFTFTALLLQLGVLSLLASIPRLATLLMGSAIIVIFLFYRTTAFNQSQLPPRLPKATVRFSITLSFAIILVAASLTPYLAVPAEDANAVGAGLANEHSILKPTPGSERSKASFLQSARLWFRRFLAETPQSSAKGKRGSDVSPSHLRLYSALQALFGESEAATESTPLEKTLHKGTLTTLVPDDSFHGVLLRPKSDERVSVTPPSPTQRVFDGKANERKVDPVSIPFYGAYWFFRASDKTLPVDAAESRGDPASTSFKTTDYTPISMEAHQNFGSLIELSCCKAIELVISNGDRHPATVAVELILTNTTLPSKPHQSLGLAPVNSTLRWFSGDQRPPVTEVLSFGVPAQAAIQSFDEATIRFELRSPREPWSAKIAIEKFRLIPREF